MHPGPGVLAVERAGALLVLSEPRGRHLEGGGKGGRKRKVTRGVNIVFLRETYIRQKPPNDARSRGAADPI